MQEIENGPLEYGFAWNLRKGLLHPPLVNKGSLERAKQISAVPYLLPEHALELVGDEMPGMLLLLGNESTSLLKYYASSLPEIRVSVLMEARELADLARENLREAGLSSRLATFSGPLVEDSSYRVFHASPLIISLYALRQSSDPGAIVEILAKRMPIGATLICGGFFSDESVLLEDTNSSLEGVSHILWPSGKKRLDQFLDCLSDNGFSVDELDRSFIIKKPGFLDKVLALPQLISKRYKLSLNQCHVIQSAFDAEKISYVMIKACRKP